MVTRGISFNNTHSYYDLNLILSASEITPAEPKTNYVDIPGADSSADLTEAHGEVKFSDRECSFTFTMNPADELTDAAFEEKKTEVSNLLNGKECKITLDKDADFYYLGRCTVSEYLSDRRLKQIVVTARVHPYKFKQDITTVEERLSEVAKELTIKNGRKSVVPVIKCTHKNTMIVFKNATFNLSAGQHKILDIQFVEGKNIVTVSGEGAVTFTFQEGEL